MFWFSCYPNPQVYSSADRRSAGPGGHSYSFNGSNHPTENPLFLRHWLPPSAVRFCYCWQPGCTFFLEVCGWLLWICVGWKNNILWAPFPSGCQRALKGFSVCFALFLLSEHIITLNLAVLWVFRVHDEQNACIHSLPRISHKHDNLSRNSSRNMMVFQVSFCGGFSAAVLIFRVFPKFFNK